LCEDLGGISGLVRGKRVDTVLRKSNEGKGGALRRKGYVSFAKRSPQDLAVSYGSKKLPVWEGTIFL
jgi:hypothetical protein